jgi:hypothetical protein
MNDRVKALAEQAGFSFWGDCFFVTDPKSTGLAELDKFSALLLDQCAELVGGYYDERAMQWAGPTIKEYFGVEE